MQSDLESAASQRMARLGSAFANTYAQLPARFFARTVPTPVSAPRLIKFNAALAAQLGLSVELGDDELARVFSGNLLVPGSEPIAMAYAGHQFGHFVPQLGDGRAILLGEVRDREGRRRDLQLKGSGRTFFSRGGDGRAAIGPVLREYLVSEAMHALGVPATRALAAVATGDTVYRETPVPGAILTRIAASHVRVGTFQFFAARGDGDAVRRLADYVIGRHYPEVASADNPYLELLRAVVRRQAYLVAAWMDVGFIHGVMNTDNTAISGETIDFGPCAFMDTYDPMAVFSSIDQRGRYAYGNQPAAAQWNLARFAETLLPLIDPLSERAIGRATAVIEEFQGLFAELRRSGARRKLGLFQEEDDDAQLMQSLLEIMHRQQVDFTLTFRRLCDAAEGVAGQAAFEASFSDPAAVGEWLHSWRARAAREPQPAGEQAAFMRRVNPAVIPRNHRIEQAIEAAERGDFTPFEALSSALARPFDEASAAGAYAMAPRPDERVTQTFCGT